MAEPTIMDGAGEPHTDSTQPMSPVQIDPLVTVNIVEATGEGLVDIIARKRTVSVMYLTFLSFFIASGGPYGLEDALGAGGPLLTLIAFCSLPIIYALPQALMTAELSTMLDENGGYILWVDRGLGKFWGWMNAFNSLFNNIFDLALYPVLFADYLQQLLSHFHYSIPDYGVFLIKLGFVLVLTYCNIRGMELVGVVSGITCAIITIPFFVELGYEAPHMEPSSWADVPEHIDWSLFLNTVLWAFTGWASLGCVAGEIDDATKTFPRAIVLGLLLNATVYIIPVIVGWTVSQDYALWTDGYFSTVASKIRPWLGYWVVTGAMSSALGQYLVCLSTTSRALWAIAGGGDHISQKLKDEEDDEPPRFPTVFRYTSKQYGTPVAAIWFMALTTISLMHFKFGLLVQCDSFLNSVSLVIQFSAFVRLKYTEADTARPFKVPGGAMGAWLITLPKLAVVICAMALTTWKVWAVSVGINVVIVIAYVVWSRWRKQRRRMRRMALEQESSAFVNHDQDSINASEKTPLLRKSL